MRASCEICSEGSAGLVWGRHLCNAHVAAWGQDERIHKAIPHLPREHFDRGEHPLDRECTACAETAEQRNAEYRRKTEKWVALMRQERAA